MFCPKCGKINPDTEKLCSGCGAELREEQVIAPKKSKKGLKFSGIRIFLSVMKDTPLLMRL